jgi:hypothetical protein
MPTNRWLIVNVPNQQLEENGFLATEKILIAGSLSLIDKAMESGTNGVFKMGYRL